MSGAAVLERPAKVPVFRPMVWMAVAVGLVVLCAAPLGISAYWLRVLTTVLMYVVITQGLNVIVGITGYHAFGNGVFFGIGASLRIPMAAARRLPPACWRRSRCPRLAP